MPAGRQPAGIHALAPGAVKAARRVRGRAQGVIPGLAAGLNPCVQPITERVFLREVCDQETAHRRKCLCDLVVVKGGESPPRGGVGNLRNPCCGRWTRRLIAGVVQLGKCPDRTLEQKGHWGRAQKPEARANSSIAKCAVKVLLAEQIEEPSPRGDGPGARADMPADDLNSNSSVSGALYGLRPAETWGMRPGMEDEHGWITSRFA